MRVNAAVLLVLCLLTISHAWDCQEVVDINNLMQIDAGLGQVVATDTSLLKQLDAGGDQFVVGANMDDTPFCLTSSATVGYKGPDSPLPWTGLPGAVKYYSCGPFGCWAVNKNDDIYLMSYVNKDTCQNKGWSHIEGKLSMIEVATDGSVFGVNSVGSVYTRDGITASKPEGTGWSNIPMCMLMGHVTYDLGRLWVVSKSAVTMVCTP
ncbi:fish-egg lectin-like [Salmo salar]|uniref:Fish-egg lectin-like n=1 Tax=Salmo salar TaxID=8030 RepID=A0ABM3F588_SALSA|nr:fish-egg lectin-like [Salmo salar]